jgi:hypothetical protein
VATSKDKKDDKVRPKNGPTQEGELMSHAIEPGAIESTVNPERCALAFNLLRNVPACQNVVGVIKRYLFADGIEITHNEQPIQAEKEFEEHLTHYYQRYGEDCIDWILCVGVVPITFSYIQETCEYVPVVIKHGAGSIRSVYKNHRQKFYYQPYGRRNEGTKVIVLSGFGYDPTIGGQLISLINCLLPMETASSVLLDCATVSERIWSNPSYVLQMRKDASKPQNRLGIDYGLYAEFDTTDSRNEQHIWRRDTNALERLKRQNDELYDTYYRPNALNSVQPDPRGQLRPEKPWQDNEYHVPDNMELVKQTLPEARNDLIAILQFNNSEIYNTLGVPENMATGNMGTKSGNVDAINDMFKTTILWWKRTIGKQMSIGYNIIYGESDAQYVLKVFFDTTGLNALEITEDLIYSLQKTNKIKIGLPIPPFITTQELLMFFQQGALTEEEYCNYLRRRANLPYLEKVPFVPPRAGEEALQKEEFKASLKTKTEESKSSVQPAKRQKNDK